MHAKCMLRSVHTKTIRIREQTHRSLAEISAATGRSLIEVVDAALDALRREHFANSVAAQIERLRDDPAAWEEYLSDAELTSVSDGIDR